MYFNSHSTNTILLLSMSKNLDHQDNVSVATDEPEEEKSFRERYSQELKGKKQQIYGKHQGYNELEDERKRVRQQMMRTPGRRGEIIKEEEINKEIGRRYTENQAKND
jgi:hypothetical protein